MTERVLILAIAALAGAAAFGVYAIVRLRTGDGPEFLDIEDLGLELMSGCCAFVVFTSAACRPCKAAMNVVREASSSSEGLTEMVAVDAIERSDLATRYGVRTVPSVFLVTASGHVVGRWKGVPERREIDDSLRLVGAGFSRRRPRG